MGEMRTVWVIASLLLVAALALMWWPSAPSEPVVLAPNTIDQRAEPNPPPSRATAQSLESLVGGSLTTTTPTTVTPEVTAGAKAVIERVDDHTMRLDGKYTVRGSGTEGDPYQISWELLQSVASTVDAAKREYVVPGRVGDLRGAWIRISGYWAPPLQVFETKEAMLMLNKWDGCCIGLPPTPFDSIEASFTVPLRVEGQHVYRYGTVKGRLMVEPFAAGTFLLGLYRLQDAVMESSS